MGPQELKTRAHRMSISWLFPLYHSHGHMVIPLFRFDSAGHQTEKESFLWFLTLKEWRTHFPVLKFELHQRHPLDSSQTVSCPCSPEVTQHMCWVLSPDYPVGTSLSPSTTTQTGTTPPMTPPSMTATATQTTTRSTHGLSQRRVRYIRGKRVGRQNESQTVPWIEYDIVRVWDEFLRIFKIFSQQCDYTPLVSLNFQKESVKWGGGPVWYKSMGWGW